MMSLGARIRRAGFWSLDAAKGGPVRRQYRDVATRLSDPHEDTEQLERILDHAARTTPFYSAYRGGDLGAFPITDRSTHRAHAQELRSSQYEDAPLHERLTSGTSGQPLRIEWDATKRHRAIADLIYFNESAGLGVGDRFVWFRTWLHDDQNSPSVYLRNIVPFRMMGLDDTVLEKLARALRDEPIACILATASTLATVAKYVERRTYDPADFHLRAVISGAETLDRELKRHMEAAFGCPVVDRYANEENGVLASTLPGDDRFQLNRASFHFEFLKLEADEPAAPGELARIVVTDLYNRASPMIRYDTGDLAAFDAPNEGLPTTLEAVQGRTADLLYDTKGRELTAGTVAGIMRKFDDIARYQLVQDDRVTFRLRVVLDGSRFKESDFREWLEPWLGPGAKLCVEFVDSIPSEPSGKFRTVVSNYEPDGSAD